MHQVCQVSRVITDKVVPTFGALIWQQLNAQAYPYNLCIDDARKAGCLSHHGVRAWQKLLCTSNGVSWQRNVHSRLHDLGFLWLGGQAGKARGMSFFVLANLANKEKTQEPERSRGDDRVNAYCVQGGL